MEALLPLLLQGLTALPSIIQAGGDAVGLIEKMRGAGQKAQEGTLTDQDLEDLEADLDARISKFNEPM